MATPRHGALYDALRTVIDPELGADVVDLGMVSSARIDSDGIARVAIALTISGCPLRREIEAAARRAILSVDGVVEVDLSFAEMAPAEREALMGRARLKARERSATTAIAASTRVFAIGSGKGGVGKSSVSVNLAVALARRGERVGLLDADIWGFSVPRLLGMSGPIEAKAMKMQPVERAIGDGVLRVLSMGFLSGEDRAIMWRGLLLNRAVQQFVEDADWGDLDYLVIDLPPGTGDVQMGLARLLPQAEMVVVTTPPLAAQSVAARAADMARRGYMRVVGVIENMSYFVCAHGERYPLFGEGGGRRLADELGVELLGSIPIDPSIPIGGDAGHPVALDGGGVGDVFEAIADSLRALPGEVSGCTARMLDALDASVAPIKG